MRYRIGLAATAVLGVVASFALAGGIEAGLWKITTTGQIGGVEAPPRQSSKCLTAEQVADLAVTFAPVATTVNSECAPIERQFDGQRLRWHLVCKGQLDMELSGDFNFDTPRHYTGTVESKAAMAGQPMAGSKYTVEGVWVSACPQ